MNDAQTTKPISPTIFILRGTLLAALFSALSLLGAGRWDWPRGWLYVGLMTASSLIGGAIVEWANPGLLEARAKGYGRKDTKPFDRIFYRLFVPVLVVYPLLAGLDAGRFLWSPLPSWTFWPSLALFLLGSIVTTWTMCVNRFAEGTVRIQSDRGQSVINAGPYRLVRHPMYTGVIIGLPATALLLGSGWALVPVAIVIALFIWRTAREDATLRQELEGYEEFTKMTRYRLFPGLW